VTASSDPHQLHVQGATADGRFTFSYQSPERSYENVHLALRGRHQLVNAAIAIEVAESLRRCGFEIFRQAIIEGLETVVWPGRLEIHTAHASMPVLLLDGAHNPAGAKVLRQYLSEFGRRPLTIIFGAMQDKRIEEMAAEVFPLAQTVILTKVEDQRAADAQRLGQVAATHPSVITTDSVGQAMERALSLTPVEGMICVTGSLYLVGDAKQWWQATEPQPLLMRASAGLS
jgi:dihydrofolate synthase/folylpolyglutamate synthase